MNATNEALIRCEIITEEKVFFDIEEEWNDLWKKSINKEYFLTHCFCRHSWLEVDKPTGKQLFCISIRQNDNLVLLWPLVIFRRGPYKIIRPLGPHTAESTEMLYASDGDFIRNLQMAWEVVTLRSGCDVLNLPYVKATSHLHAVLPESSIGLPMFSPYATFHDQTSWDDYCKLIGTNSKQQLNRKRKRLSELGELEFVALKTKENPQESARLISWMMEQKRNWANRNGKSGPWLYSPYYLNFLIKVISDPSNIQEYIIYAAMVNKEPIAVKLAAIESEHINLYIAGYDLDPKYSKYSPGLVLDHFWVREIFEQRKDVDFGVGMDSYKLFWSRDNAIETNSFLIPLSIFGKLSVKLIRNLDGIKVYINKLRRSIQLKKT